MWVRQRAEEWLCIVKIIYHNDVQPVALKQIIKVELFAELTNQHSALNITLSQR